MVTLDADVSNMVIVRLFRDAVAFHAIVGSLVGLLCEAATVQLASSSLRFMLSVRPYSTVFSFHLHG